jgi:hypothetical protein
MDAERREQAQPASDSSNRSQNRYDQQTNVREHWTSLNTRAIREKSRLTKLRDHGEGAAKTDASDSSTLAESGENQR